MSAETLDRRVHATRPDLADARLKDRVSADRFVEGTLRRVIAAVAPMRREPRADGPLDTARIWGPPIPRRPTGSPCRQPSCFRVRT